MPATILDMGSVLKAWRQDANCSYEDFAHKLWRKRFRLAASTERLARDLRDMEERDVWPYDDDDAALMRFAFICRRALVSRPAQRAYADDLLRVVLIYHAASRLGIELALLPPPYTAALTPFPWWMGRLWWRKWWQLRLTPKRTA